MADPTIMEAALLASTGRMGDLRMEDCGSAHGRVLSEIAHLKESDKGQWLEINNMKRILLTSLGAIIVTMLGVIINLIITVARTGAHP